MTPQLPLPVRVAAGLVATAVEQARDLPRLALELPVTAVSQALQASMRVQQKVTELAIKGDRVLGMGPSIEDEPPWATFDDDLPLRRNGRTGDAPTKVTTLRSVDLFAEPGPVEPASVDPGPAPPPAPGGTTPPASSPAAGEDGPQVLPGYGFTIPQLRGKLRHFSVDDPRALLAEQAHGDRPPYVTMLSNRIAAVTEGECGERAGPIPAERPGPSAPSPARSPRGWTGSGPSGSRASSRRSPPGRVRVPRSSCATLPTCP